VQKVTGKRYDIGDKLSYVKAIIDFSLQRDDLAKDVRDYLGFKFS
jgi:UTP--glucose-1-phosphate uridylyltransferase